MNWVIACMVPIYKGKGDVHECSNFRGTVYYRVKGENLRLVFVVKIHGSPFTREILLDS